MNDFGFTELAIIVGIVTLAAYLIKESRDNKREAKALKKRMDDYVPPIGGGGDDDDEEEEE